MFEIAIIALIIVAMALVVFDRTRFKPPQTLPSSQSTYRNFTAAPSLFVTRSELQFFHALHNAIPDDLFVLSKVRLEDIIGVKASVKHAEKHWKLRARVKSRHVDFLVIDKTGAPCVAVELDGSIHDEVDTFHADTLKNGLFKEVGIPLIRVPNTADFHTVAEEVANHAWLKSQQITKSG